MDRTWLAERAKKAKIPDSIAAWANLLSHLGLDPHMTLRQIKDDSVRPVRVRPAAIALSGSTMTIEDFLFLRAIGPEVLRSTEDRVAVLSHHGLIDQNSWVLALQKLVLDQNLEMISLPSQQSISRDPPTPGLSTASLATQHPQRLQDL